MKTITEKEAKELANLTGKIVTMNRYGEVMLFSHPPIPRGSNWHRQKSTHRAEPLFIKIKTDIDLNEDWFLCEWRPDEN